MCKRNPTEPMRLACVIDGETDLRKLEFHYIGGARVALCRKCFRRLLDGLRIRPARIWNPPDELERIGHALLAEADLFALLAQARWKFGQMLIDRVRRDAPDESEDGLGPIGRDQQSEPRTTEYTK